jgi:histone acetyltransferase SAS3
MPATYNDAMENQEAGVVDSDQDAEGEEDTDLYRMDQQLQGAVHKEGSGEQADEDEVEGDIDDDSKLSDIQVDKENIIAINTLEIEGNAGVEAVDAGATVMNESHIEGTKSDSNPNSEASDGDEEEWEAESNERDEIEVEKVGGNNCM